MHESVETENLVCELKGKRKTRGWKRDEKTHDSDQIQNKGGENEGWERQEKVNISDSRLEQGKKQTI